MDKALPLFAAVLAVIIVGAIAYAPSLGGTFILDDELIPLVKKNHIDPGIFYDPAKVFSGNIDALGIGNVQRYFVYRPLHFITYLIDFAIWRWNPFGFHLTSALLHILVGLALLWFLNLATKDALLSSLAALVFIAHPVHTETASYISGRGDSLAALFMLLAFSFYLAALPRGNALLYLLMAGSYALALMGKELALILPLAVLLYHYVFRVKANRVFCATLFAMGLGFLFLRMGVLRSTAPHLLAGTTVADRLPGVFAALVTYVRILFVPVGLHMEYGNLIFPYGDPLVWLGVCIFGLLVWAFVLLRRKGDSIAAFALAWFGLTLLPQSNLYPVGAYMAEHWLYMPSMGFSILLALFFKHLLVKERLRAFALFLLFALVITYSFLTIRQAAYWKDPIAFYERTLTFTKTARFCNNLGLLYAERGEHEKAIGLYRDGIAAGASFADIYINAGISYAALGMDAKAADMYMKALTVDPRSASAYRYIGDLYLKAGRFREAVTMYQKSLSLRNDPKTLNNLAEAHRLMGQDTKAAALYQESIDKDSYSGEAFNNLGALALKEGRVDEAIGLLRKATAIRENYSDALNNLGTAYSIKKEYDKAIEIFNTCIAGKPDFASAHNNLAVAYYSSGRLAEARAAETRAIELGFQANPKFLGLLGITEKESK